MTDRFRLFVRVSVHVDGLHNYYETILFLRKAGTVTQSFMFCECLPVLKLQICAS